MSKFFIEHGYYRDREQRLREIASGKHASLASEAANQIRHLKGALRELISIVEIHSSTTGNNFAWAELEAAREALGAQAADGEGQ